MTENAMIIKQVNMVGWLGMSSLVYLLRLVNLNEGKLWIFQRVNTLAYKMSGFVVGSKYVSAVVGWLVVF